MPDDAHSPAPSVADLQGEIARLRLLNRQLAASAAVQGMRAGAQGGQAHHLRQQVALMQSSSVWRATWPLRLAMDLARGAPPSASPDAQRIRRALARARQDGVSATVARLRRRLTRPSARKRTVEDATAGQPDDAGALAMPPPSRILAPSLLIIAELTLPQCAKYRVWQKQEMCRRLGRPCRVVDWRDTEDCLSAAATATQAIFYRVPALGAALRMIERLHSLGMPVAWEVDDLIFDRDLFLQNRNIDELDPELRDGVVSGVDFYRDAMLACRSGIASTPHLARAMRAAGLDEVAVIENALDEQTLDVAASLRLARGQPGHRRDGVLITYGSGTKTHDADFRQAAPALLRLLQTRQDARLRILGELNLPAAFAALGGRVEVLPPVPYPHYLRLLSETDISIAPLEASPFNDAKSNIKFIEAAILGVPSICSPRAHFTHAMRDGENGLLAETEQDWFSALSVLADDPGLRHRLGQAALRTALHDYDPDTIARTQLAPLLARAPDTRPAPEVRVLFANVYYTPRSYGGATLVVEEMARRLHAMAETEVHVVTSLGRSEDGRVVTRTDQAGIPVFAIPVADGDIVAEFDDPSAGEAFGQILDAVQPDVVHLHAVQWLSARLAAACTERGIPYVITLHDAWWLCARQFMVMGNGQYCHQSRIDLSICQNCMPGARHLQHRQALLRAALDGAALLLSPSQAHRQLFLANGIAPEKIMVAPNGVRLPPSGRPVRQRAARLRFAYVGGPVEVKGYSIVKRAFETLPRGDWTLVLVDNTLNLGFSSLDAAEWTARGKVEIVPAYSQDELDAFFAGIDVLLFPSQWKESFGLTVREALARDVWVVATDGGGPAEVITDGVNGTLIPLDGRHDGLKRAVEALLDRPGRLDGFVNPHAGEMMDYAAQANALRATLAQVAARNGTRARRARVTA